MSPRSLPYDVEFSLTRKSSFTPWPASQSASSSTSVGRRETKEPRKDGIAQNEHRRSQPLANFSDAVGPDSRRRRTDAGPEAWPGTAAVDIERSTGVIGSSRRRSLGVCAWWDSPARMPRSRSAMSG